MVSYEDFLSEYSVFMDDYEDICTILSLVPDSYRYRFVLELLEHKKYLSFGNPRTGEAVVGRIYVDYKYHCICLDDVPCGLVVLLELPHYWEV